MAIHYELGASLAPARGTTVVFVHGAGGTLEQWHFQLPHLGPRWNTLAMDLPGHGESQGNGYRTIEDYRDFVRDLLDTLGITRSVLVGHSMGGGIVQRFALAYPAGLAAVVLVGTGARLTIGVAGPNFGDCENNPRSGSLREVLLLF
jgi:pimeloyl-ACP methyl ester carboxylesterase